MKLFLTVLLISSFFLGGVAFAQDGSPLVVDTLTNLPGLEEASTGGIGPLINTLYRYGVGIGAILAVLIIIYGGFKYMTSQVPGVKADGRAEITRAILGLLLLLSPVIVFGIINQDILNFDIDLRRLDAGRDPVELGTGSGGGGVSGQCENISWRESRDNIISPDQDRSGHLPSTGAMSANQLQACCSEADGFPDSREKRRDGREYTEHFCDYRIVKLSGIADFYFTDETVIRGRRYNITAQIRRGACKAIDSQLGSEWANTQINTLYQEGTLTIGAGTLRNIGSAIDILDRIELSSSFLNPLDFRCGGITIIN